jgi:hypothetical protein
MNFLLGAAIEAMAEAAALVERYGIEPPTLIEIATGILFAAPAYNIYGKLIAQRIADWLPSPPGDDCSSSAKKFARALGHCANRSDDFVGSDKARPHGIYRDVV